MADLFGFEELTEEVFDRGNSKASLSSVSQGVDEKKMCQQNMLSIDTSACSENQIIVPILDLTGVKKYKVLARQPVEDDEPCGNTNLSETSGNVHNTLSASQQDSALRKEQRKENIIITSKCNHKHSVKKKLNAHKEFNEHIKKSFTVTKPETNILKRKLLVKNKTNDWKLKSKPNKKVWKEKAVEYEFHSDTETERNTASLNTVRSQSLDNRIISSMDSYKVGMIETACVSNVKAKQCSVKLSRSLSLDILSRSNSADLKLEVKTTDNVLTESTELETSKVEKSNVETLSRADSTDELKQMKMVFDADIDVRKSGRLKSAKCASRYRGDYGIRADTYTKLVSQRMKESTDSESDNVSCCSSLNEHAQATSRSSSVSSRVSDLEGRTTQRNPISTLSSKLKTTKVKKKCRSSSKTELPVQTDSVEEVNLLSCFCTINNEECQCKFSSSETSAVSEVPLNNPIKCDKNSDINELPQACDKANMSEGGSTPSFDLDFKQFSNCGFSDHANNSDSAPSRHTCTTKYVHAIGKSVHRKENQKVNVSKVSISLESDQSLNELSPVKTDMDRLEVLEKLRQKLFEKAGANVTEADKTSKTFESALISSKRKELQVTEEICGLGSVCEHKFKSLGSDCEACVKSDCSCAPKVEPASREILEEVSKTLENLQKVKMGSKSKPKQDLGNSYISDGVYEVEKNDSTVTCSSSINYDSEDVTEDKLYNTGMKPLTRKQSQSHHKPAKCHVCNQTFKNRDLLRKHYPCRVRQTRTWAQNKLRPNRAVKRTEPAPKKFVCQLPKSGKEKPRPMLLTYRKTKFRKVKGKRRRKLYHIIQDLIQKRKTQTWPHLSVIFDDLSFKEQFMYKVGLICVGSASDGLENYTAEEIDLFEQHRAIEKLVNNDVLLQPFPTDLDLSIASVTDSSLETSTNQELETSANQELETSTNQELETSTNRESNLESSFLSSVDQNTALEEYYIHDSCSTKNIDSIESDLGFHSDIEMIAHDNVQHEINFKEAYVHGIPESVVNDVHVTVEQILKGNIDVIETTEELVDVAVCTCDLSNHCKETICGKEISDVLHVDASPLTVDSTDTVQIGPDECADTNVAEYDVCENQVYAQSDKITDNCSKLHVCKMDLPMTSDDQNSLYNSQSDEQFVESNVVDQPSHEIPQNSKMVSNHEKSNALPNHISDSSLIVDSVFHDQTVVSAENVNITDQETTENWSPLLENTDKTFAQHSTKEVGTSDDDLLITNDDTGDEGTGKRTDNTDMDRNSEVIFANMDKGNTVDDLKAIYGRDHIEDDCDTSCEKYELEHIVEVAGIEACKENFDIKTVLSYASSERTHNKQQEKIEMPHENSDISCFNSQDREIANTVCDVRHDVTEIKVNDIKVNEATFKAPAVQITCKLYSGETPDIEMQQEMLNSANDSHSSDVHSDSVMQNMDTGGKRENMGTSDYRGDLQHVGITGNDNENDDKMDSDVFNIESHSSSENSTPVFLVCVQAVNVPQYVTIISPECSQDDDLMINTLAHGADVENVLTAENNSGSVDTECHEEWIPLAPDDVLQNILKMGVDKDTQETKDLESSDLCKLPDSSPVELKIESPNRNKHTSMTPFGSSLNQLSQWGPVQSADILKTVELPRLKILKKLDIGNKSTKETARINAEAKCNEKEAVKLKTDQVMCGMHVKRSESKRNITKPKPKHIKKQSDTSEEIHVQNAIDSGLKDRNHTSEGMSIPCIPKHAEECMQNKSTSHHPKSSAKTKTFRNKEVSIIDNKMEDKKMSDERIKRAKHISLEEYMKKKGLTFHPVKPKISEKIDYTDEIKVDLVSNNEEVANEGDLHCNIVFVKENDSSVTSSVCTDPSGILADNLQEGSEKTEEDLKNEQADKTLCTKQSNLYNVEDTQHMYQNCDEYDPESNFLLDTGSIADESDLSKPHDIHEENKEACFVENLLMAVSLIHEILEDQRKYCSENGIEIQSNLPETEYSKQSRFFSMDQRADSLHSYVEENSKNDIVDDNENDIYVHTGGSSNIVILKQTNSPVCIANVTECDHIDIKKRESVVSEDPREHVESVSEIIFEDSTDDNISEEGEYPTEVCNTSSSINQSDIESLNTFDECLEISMATAETKREEKHTDYTIKYEMNGLFIKENVLTGDKNLIESLSTSSSSPSPRAQILVETPDIKIADEAETWLNRKRFNRNSSECLESPEVMRKSKYDCYENNYEKKTQMKAIAAVVDNSNENDVEILNESEVGVGDANAEYNKKPVQTNPVYSQNEDALVLQIDLQPVETMEYDVRSNVRLKSPPLLEKIEDSSSLMFDDTSSQETVLSSGPPSLEPEEINGSFETNTCVPSLQNIGMKRPERHFLDILEHVHDENDKFLNADGEHFDSEKNQKNTDVNENFGRHFSDFISDQEAATNTELQILFDKSEKGEVTLAEIEHLLKPPVEMKRSISLTSLLKVRQGICKLLSQMEWPGKKAPSWLKRHALSDCAKRKRSEISLKNYSTSFEESSDEDAKIGSNDGFKNETCKSITHNIMQMLKNFENKGTIADNMTMLLNVLAESLGFSGKRSMESIDIEPTSENDSSYQDSSYAELPNLSPTQCAVLDNTQKELLEDFLEKGDQPPSLDDISTAEDTDLNETVGLETRTDEFEKAENVNVHSHIAVPLNTSVEDKKSSMPKMYRDLETHCNTFPNKSLFDDGNTTNIKFLNSDSSRCDMLHDQQGEHGTEKVEHMQTSFMVEKGRQYSSESKVFKSITELNTIANSDDESYDSDDYSISFPRSKLSGKDDAWEMNSDYHSDTDSDRDNSPEHRAVKTTPDYCNSENVQTVYESGNSSGSNSCNATDQVAVTSNKVELASEINNRITEAKSSDMHINQKETTSSYNSVIDNQVDKLSSELDEFSSDTCETVDEADCDSSLTADEDIWVSKTTCLKQETEFKTYFDCGPCQPKEDQIDNLYAANFAKNGDKTAIANAKFPGNEYAYTKTNNSDFVKDNDVTEHKNDMEHAKNFASSSDIEHTNDKEDAINMVSSNENSDAENIEDVINMVSSNENEDAEDLEDAINVVSFNENEDAEDIEDAKNIVRSNETEHAEDKEDAANVAGTDNEDKDDIDNAKLFTVHDKQHQSKANKIELYDSDAKELFLDCGEQPKCSTPIHSHAVTLDASSFASYKTIDQVGFSYASWKTETSDKHDSVDQPDKKIVVRDTVDKCNGGASTHSSNHQIEKLHDVIKTPPVETNLRENLAANSLLNLSRHVTSKRDVEVKHDVNAVENEQLKSPLISYALLDDNDSVDSDCTVTYCEEQINLPSEQAFELEIPCNTMQSKVRDDFDQKISDRMLHKLDKVVMEHQHVSQTKNCSDNAQKLEETGKSDQLIETCDLSSKNGENSQYCKPLKEIVGEKIIQENIFLKGMPGPQNLGVATTFPPKPSTSRNPDTLDINIEDYQPGGIYCESIAEKVKRKQRERALPVIYNPWIYDGGNYSYKKKTPKKEISVFRSTILEKRAREQTGCQEKDECSTNKNLKLSSKKECVNTKKQNNTEYAYLFHNINIRPCSVQIVRLSDRTIERYARKRKLNDNPSDRRPPIKVKIKLNQIMYPIISHETFTDPPMSPDPSEESGSEDVLNNSDTINDASRCSSSDKSPVHSNTDRQPIKIKMKTLLTKMNSCDKGDDSSTVEAKAKAYPDASQYEARADVHFYISDSESETSSTGKLISEYNSKSESRSSTDSDSEDEIQETIEHILDSRDGDVEQCGGIDNNRSEQIRVPDKHLSDNEESENENDCLDKTCLGELKGIGNHCVNGISWVKTSLDLSESESDDNYDQSVNVSSHVSCSSLLSAANLQHSTESQQSSQKIQNIDWNECQQKKASENAANKHGAQTNSPSRSSKLTYKNNTNIKNGISGDDASEIYYRGDSSLIFPAQEFLQYAGLESNKPGDDQVSEAVNSLQFDSFHNSDHAKTTNANIDCDMYYAAEIVQNDLETKDAVVYIESEETAQEAMIEHEPELYEVVENQVVSTSYADDAEILEEMVATADEEICVKETSRASVCGFGADRCEPVQNIPSSKYVYGISEDSPSSNQMDTVVTESSEVLSLECEVVYDEFTVT